MAAEDDSLADDGSTPSQRELDATVEGDQIANALRWQGQLLEAKRQVQGKVARGGSKGMGRELLGQIDDLAQNYDADAAAQFGKDMDSFIHTGVGAASQPASTPPGTPSGTPSRTPRARPSTPVSRRSDNERLLNRDTPISEIREIRARQKKAGE